MIELVEDNILVTEIVEEKTASGIILHANNSKDFIKALVHNVGPGKILNDIIITPQVNVGDIVLVKHKTGIRMGKPNKENIYESYIILNEKDVIAIVGE